MGKVNSKLLRSQAKSPAPTATELAWVLAATLGRTRARKLDYPVRAAKVKAEIPQLENWATVLKVLKVGVLEEILRFQRHQVGIIV